MIEMGWDRMEAVIGRGNDRCKRTPHEQARNQGPKHACYYGPQGSPSSNAPHLETTKGQRENQNAQPGQIEPAGMELGQYQAIGEPADEAPHKTVGEAGPWRN